MLISDIVKSVRLCIDEKDTNASSLADTTVLGSDSGLMDDIIKDKIGDAVRWVCLFAPADMLGGTDATGTATGVMKDDTPTPSLITNQTAGTVTLGSDFIKLARVRVAGWHRAVRVPISEDSEEYLQLYDTNGATATADRPQAALIEKSQRCLELWPWSSGPVEVTYVSSVETLNTYGSGDSQGYALPPRAKTAIIYYLAFLVCSAYGDPRAARMLEIAKMSLGTSDRIA